MDFRNIKDDNTHVCGVSFVDVSDAGLSNKAHLDFIQGIGAQGYNPHSKVSRPHYALASLTGMKVTDCYFQTKGSMQGVTGFDGMFYDVCVENCTFTLASKHKVTFCGLMSGSFHNLHSYNKADTPIEVQLYNARVGGGTAYTGQTRIVEIASFLEEDYYEALYGDTVKLTDLRGTVRDNVITLANFDLVEFKKYIEYHAPQGSAQYVAHMYQEAAFLFGDKL